MLQFRLNNRKEIVNNLEKFADIATAIAIGVALAYGLLEYLS